MKTIYRVEHYDRRHGPYEASYNEMNKKCKKLAEKLDREFLVEQHPPPLTDGIRDYSVSHYCGFDSLDALLDWFEEWLEDLEECGYHVAIFEVEDSELLHGNKQVMFKRKEHRRKQALKLSEAANETR